MKKIIITTLLITSIFANTLPKIETVKIDNNKKVLIDKIDKDTALFIEMNYQISEQIKIRDKKIIDLETELASIKQELIEEKKITDSIKNSLGDLTVKEINNKIKKFNDMENSKINKLVLFKDKIKKYSKIVNISGINVLSYKNKIYKTNNEIDGYLIKGINKSSILFYGFEVSL